MRNRAHLRVVGSFNNLSDNWLDLLWARVGGPDAGLEHDFWYPGERTRTGLPVPSRSAYAEALARQIRLAAADTIVTVLPRAGSVWRDADYRAWNAWKAGYDAALRAHRDVVPIGEKVFDEAGITVAAYRLVAHDVRYAAGWLPPEAWGRWAGGRTAGLRIPGAAGADSLVIRAAPFGGQDGPQHCRVVCGAHVLGEFTVAGRGWRWADYAVPLPHSTADTLDVRLEFGHRWPAGPQDPRLLALPVQSIRVVRRAGHG